MKFPLRKEIRRDYLKVFFHLNINALLYFLTQSWEYRRGVGEVAVVRNLTCKSLSFLIK